MTNIVAIDPSLTCSAVVVNGIRFAFVSSNVAQTKTENLAKWFKECEPLIEYNFLNYDKVENYSKNEVIKLLSYDTTVYKIKEVILKNIIPGKEIKVLIEGYSYSSNAGPLIDLVTFSTLLRKQMLELTSDVNILSPSQLKLEAAKFTYPVTVKGKKVLKYEYRNNAGMAGGKFTKFEMMKALTENNNLEDDWTIFLRYHAKDIFSYKSIPKPIEDINDAMLLYHVGKTYK